VREVGVSEAKTHLSSLLRDVEAGEELFITRRGKRVARLIGDAMPSSRSRSTGDKIAARLMAFRERVRQQWPSEPDFDWKRAVIDGRE
jgi:prevent-host-death family protein